MEVEFPKVISGIYGEGLIASILFHIEDNRAASFQNVSIVAEKCMQKGLLVVHTGRESIKIGPPLTIPDDALIEGIEIINESIHEVFND